MRTQEQITADARPGPAFSNSTEFDLWAVRWCWAPCAHDDEDVERYCPILTVAWGSGVIPREWEPRGMGYYVCTEFQAVSDEDSDPEPPQIPGQLDIFGGTDV